MKTHEISVTTGFRKENEVPPLKFSIEMPETVDEAVETYGADVVVSKFVDAAVIAFQAAARLHMDDGKRVNSEGKPDPKGTHLPKTKDGKDKVWSDSAIVAHMDNWELTLREPGKSKVEKTAGMFSDLSDEDRAKVMSQMKEMMKAKK